MNVWFPEFFTEAHREPNHGRTLAGHLSEFGIRCVPEFTPKVDLIFCGSIWKAPLVRPYLRARPVVHYNWDIYPFQVQGAYSRASDWADYIQDLKRCARILVPSRAVVTRTKEYTKVDSYIVLAPVRPFALGREPKSGDYAIDVMRKYPDPNQHAARSCCEQLGIPLVETGTTRPWEEFVDLVCNARFLVSAYFEASTGGLTLLEGYQLGKPCIISRSPYHGAYDYFGDRAATFDYDQWDHLKFWLTSYWEHPPQLDPVECRDWVMTNYSDRVFAGNLAHHFKEVLNGHG